MRPGRAAMVGWLVVALAAALSASAGFGPEPPDAPSRDDTAATSAAASLAETLAPLEVPSRIDDPPLARVTSIAPEHDLLARAVRGEGGRWVVEVDGRKRPLTIVPALQEKLTGILRRYETPWAAVVALDPKTGRVLAMAEHSQVDPSLRGLPVKAVFPAASIFKIVTAAALLDEGVAPDHRVCAPHAKRRVSLKHLESDGGGRCMTLEQAMAQSANAMFAKLTTRHLSADKLAKWAEAFHFNRPIDFPIPTDMSLAAFPEDTLELARTGAGFGDVFLSPLHGAALAAVAANDGVWRHPVLFADEPPDGAGGPVRVLGAAQAQALAGMLEETVTSGTARRVFHERGFRVPGAVGKTGSLADKRPFRDYSWFVGYAPKDDPKVVVAAVVVNDYYWRIRATWLGREAMRLYLELAEDEGTDVAAAR